MQNCRCPQFRCSKVHFSVGAVTVRLENVEWSTASSTLKCVSGVLIVPHWGSEAKLRARVVIPLKLKMFQNEEMVHD